MCPVQDYCSIEPLKCKEATYLSVGTITIISLCGLDVHINKHKKHKYCWLALAHEDSNTL